MNKITKYNKLIEEIVFDFVKRLYKEENIGEEPDKSDYRIMDYKGVASGIVEIWDRYLSLNDILMCEAHKIPTKILFDYYDEDLEAHNCNFYNYALKYKKE